MDYNSINTSISKAFYKGVKLGIGSLDESTVGVTVDGCVMWFIPDNDFLFDKNKLLKIGRDFDVKSFTKTDGYIDAVKTNELIILDKKTLVIFKGNDVEVLVDVKLLKQFDKSATFKIKKNISPVMVYENGVLVGLVMPVRPRKK